VGNFTEREDPSHNVQNSARHQPLNEKKMSADKDLTNALLLAPGFLQPWAKENLQKLIDDPTRFANGYPAANSSFWKVVLFVVFGDILFLGFSGSFPVFLESDRS
jgi:hypothetical protein